MRVALHEGAVGDEGLSRDSDATDVREDVVDRHRLHLVRELLVQPPGGHEHQPALGPDQAMVDRPISAKELSDPLHLLADPRVVVDAHLEHPLGALQQQGLTPRLALERLLGQPPSRHVAHVQRDHLGPPRLVTDDGAAVDEDPREGTVGAAHPHRQILHALSAQQPRQRPLLDR